MKSVSVTREARCSVPGRPGRRVACSLPLGAPESPRALATRPGALRPGGVRGGGAPGPSGRRARDPRTPRPRFRLVGGLASENVRWAESVENFRSQGVTLCGDVLLISAFVSYVGYFTKKYRNELMDRFWVPYINKLKVSGRARSGGPRRSPGAGSRAQAPAMQGGHCRRPGRPPPTPFPAGPWWRRQGGADGQLSRRTGPGSPPPAAFPWSSRPRRPF